MISGRKKIFKKCIIYMLLLSLIIPGVGAFPAFGLDTVAVSIEDIQKRQQETKDRMESVEALKKEAEDVLKALQGEADRLEGKYADYAVRLDGITAEIYRAAKAISETEERISALQTELGEAREDEARTKEIMKMHIQYMYENNSNQSLIISLFYSESPAAFLKRAEYTAAIIRNDQNLIDKYQDEQEKIKRDTEELEKKQSDLKKYQDNMVAQVDGLKALTEEAKNAYQEKTGEVYVAQGTVEEYNSMMSELKSAMAALEAQQAEAQMELAKQLAPPVETHEEPQEPEDTPADSTQPEGTEASGETDSGGETVDEEPPAESPEESESNVVDGGSAGGSGAAYGAGEYERQLLGACIQAEAWGEGTVGQLAVGTVIMNRVADGRFSGSVTGVIQQSGQFASWSSGAVSRIMERGVAPECLEAADKVLGGYRSGNWLFFMTQRYADKFGITGYTMIGNHAFFYKWGAN